MTDLCCWFACALSACVHETPLPVEVALFRRASRVYCACVDRSVVGVAAVVGKRHLATLAVAEQYRRRGIGRTLCALWLSECGTCGTATLERRAGDAATEALYTSLGFACQARQSGGVEAWSREAAPMERPPSIEGVTFPVLER